MGYRTFDASLLHGTILPDQSTVAAMGRKKKTAIRSGLGGGGGGDGDPPVSIGAHQTARTIDNARASEHAIMEKTRKQREQYYNNN